MASLRQLSRIFFRPATEASEPAPLDDAGIPKVFRGVPPLRQSPFEPDEFDSRRVEYVKRLWHGQDHLLRARDRQIEENIRMLCGQQWAIWSELAGRYVDITRYLSDEERRWRQFPVMNRLLLWFMLTHARMTENPPVVSFQPASGDRADAELAEVMDAVFKHIWQNASMLEVIDQLTAWLIPGGTAYLKSRIDPNRGELREFRGPARLTLLDADGNPVLGPDGQPIYRDIPDAPYGPNGEVRVRLNPETGEPEIVGPPHTMHEGEIVVDVLSPLEVRGQWGPTPWHRKSWHIHRVFLTPEQGWEAYGVEWEPEVMGQEAHEIAELQRLLFGAGYYGAASGREETVANAMNPSREGFVEVFEFWHAPSRFPGMEQTRESPGGRLLTVTRTKVLRDGVRYAPFPYTSPIRQFIFVRVPGRPSGTSPQEMLNGPARTRNRLVAAILEHTNKTANPIKLIDRRSGIKEGMVTNRPGLELYGDFSQVPEPLRFVSPPSLSHDVYRALNILTNEHDELGNIPGAQGAPPTADASGELVKELRYNADRFIGPTQRRTVIELARMVEDWMVMIPLIWDAPKVIRLAGDDFAAQTITVLPEMFERGKVHVVPDIESMLPEGRGERQARVQRIYELGGFGPPGSPEAIERWLELSRFPHLSRTARPGGVDRSTAEQNVAKLLRGVPASEIPIFEWYDHGIHLAVLERYMKSPAYLRLPIHVQQEMVTYRQMLRLAALSAFQNNVALQSAMQQTAQRAAIANAAARRAEAEARGLGPEPPDRGPTAETPPRAEPLESAEVVADLVE